MTMLTTAVFKYRTFRTFEMLKPFPNLFTVCRLEDEPVVWVDCVNHTRYYPPEIVLEVEDGDYLESRLREAESAFLSGLKGTPMVTVRGDWRKIGDVYRIRASALVVPHGTFLELE